MRAGTPAPPQPSYSCVIWGQTGLVGRAWALVLAAGAGTRFGVGADGATKVTVPVAGRPMVAWSVEAAEAACDGVTLVVPVQLADELVD
ncbi:MAG: NTP transferase domain-containing protein, partial [Acidimicrobiales bacterium]|nr:NTP transferase domain-containing protein [Acidimicrobiales bacterium]